MGASGTLCGPFHSFCKTLAFAGTWPELGKFDVPALIGGEPRKLITVSGVAAAAGDAASVRVPAGRSMLFVTATQANGSPALRLTAPGGKIYTHSTRRILFNQQAQFRLTTIAVIDPKPGRWRVESTSSARVSFGAQTVGALTLLHAGGISPESSRRHPLGAHSRVILSWGSSHLPRGVRISVVRRSNPHEVGVGLGGNLPPSGRFVVPVGRLAPGRNFISIAATLHGVPFQQLTFHGVVWRAPARKHARKPRRHS
jgi:hypothetical protein